MNADNWQFDSSGVNVESGFGLAFTEVDGVRIYDARNVVPLANYPDGTVDKIGYAIHHDAVPFTDTTMRAEVARIQAIDTYHRNHNGWAGIGYHRIIAPSGRVYIVGGSATVRAHVANLNHLWIGYCFLGDYTYNRPPEPAMHALRTALQWETDKRQVPMIMAPHKRLNSDTACPGDWATKNSWLGLTLTPAAASDPLGDQLRAEMARHNQEVERIISGS